MEKPQQKYPNLFPALYCLDTMENSIEERLAEPSVAYNTVMVDPDLQSQALAAAPDLVDSSLNLLHTTASTGIANDLPTQSDDGMVVQLRVQTMLPSPAPVVEEAEVSAGNDPASRTPSTTTGAAAPLVEKGTRSNTRASTRTPTLRALLQRPTAIRRDNVDAPAPPRVELPRPKSMDIEAIDALYDAGGDWSQLAASVDRARLYALPRARYVMVIETGQAFQRTALSKILASLLKDHGNPVVRAQIEQQQLGQLTKAPGGNLRVKVKTKTACQSLAGQEVKILGGKYRFGEFDILADRFFIDVSSVESDFDADFMLKQFFDLGAQPIYGTFRDVNLEAVITTATWRVYFRSSQCPPELVVGGSVCDQLVFADRIYPVHAKNVPFPTQRLSFGQRSVQALDLASRSDTPAPDACTTPDLGSSQSSYAAVVRRGGQATSPQRSSRVSSSSIMAIVPAATPAGTPAPSELSLDTIGSSVVSPPSSPIVSRPLLLQSLPQPTPAPHSALVLVTEGKRKGKRARDDKDLANVLMKSRPKPLAGVTTSNYFAVLDSVGVEYDCCTATMDEAALPRFQIIPRKVQRCATWPPARKLVTS